MLCNTNPALIILLLVKSLFDSIVDNKVIFEATNPSNHNCIQLTITCLDNEVYSQSTQVQSNHDQTNPRCAWHKASDGNYQAYKVLLDTKLIAIEQDRNLLYCHDNSCKCVDHRNSIDVLCNSIIECCLCASDSTIPQTKPGVSKRSLDGTILLHKSWSNHCSGTGFGVSRVGLTMTIFLIL